MQLTERFSPRLSHVVLASVAAFLLGPAAAPDLVAAPPRPLDGAIRDRLDRAREQQEQRHEALSPLERDLVLLADFERDDAVLLGGGEMQLVRFEASHYRTGKFGRGFYFEKPGHNMLPPARADVETDIGGFKALGGANLAAAVTNTAFGRKALRVTASAAGDGVETVPVKVTCRKLLSWREKKWTLLASAYVNGPAGCKLLAEVAFVPKELEIKPRKSDEEEEPPERFPDTGKPQEVTLTGGWQRVACTVTSDARLRERQAVFSLRLAQPAAETATLWMDGLQFEQAGYIPHHHNMPTSWRLGGDSAPATSVAIGKAAREVFPVDRGSIALWTRTPRESNLRNPGSVTWISFGQGWQPKWCLSTYRFSAGGEGFCNFRQPAVTDGEWHHLAMTWDEAKAVVYVDGHPVESFEHKQNLTPEQLETYVLRIGGSVSDGQAANSVMDEVAVFRRTLTDAEVQSLATAANPLRAVSAPLALARSTRTVFYRDEQSALLDIPASAPRDGNLACRADWALGNLAVGQSRLDVRKGAGRCEAPFSPADFACGEYLCRVAVWPGEETPVYTEFPVWIVPALRREVFVFSSLFYGGETSEWRAFCRTLGLNCIDGGSNVEALGRDRFRHCWHARYGNGIWSPENRASVREAARAGAERWAPFPNWRFTFINTETPPWIMPGEDEREAWFDAWAEEELGFPIPEKGWRFGTTHNPIQCWFPEDEQPGENGVYAVPPRTFRFLQWWYNRGCGWWRLNAEIAAAVRESRPDVACWTDPLHYPGQIADLDAGGTWSYQLRPEPLIGDFEAAYAHTRGSGKEFYATLGMNYVKDLTSKVAVPGQKGEKTLAPTADDLIQQAWLAVAYIPSDALFYWDLLGVFHGRKNEAGRYAEPDADVRLGEVLKNDLLPLGTMLKGVPNAQRPVALLLPEGTQWMCAGQGGWDWGTTHFPNAWKTWVGGMGIPYDILFDHNIVPGALAKYQAIIFPMAEFVSERVYDELVAAGEVGTRIIVDSYCRQEYPNMTRLDQEYDRRMRDKEKYAEQQETTVGFLAALKEQLLPETPAYAVGAEGPVLTNVRETDGVQYVVVVNDLRRPGPYTEWTGNEAFQPYGKAQTATVSIKAPAGSVLYECTRSRRLTPGVEDGRLAATVELPPHAGRVIAVYPREIKAIRIDTQRRYHPGRTAAIRVEILDDSGRTAPGRQVLRVEIRDPEGRLHDESGLYPAVRGRADIPLRPALNEPAGAWSIRIEEQTSGVGASANLDVASQ